MPVAGRKPKPEGFKRNRAKPTHEWIEVPSTPYAGEVPDLPDAPATEWDGEISEPPRPLGSAGRELWERAWRTSGPAVGEADALLVACEQMDERVSLRVRVLREGNWRDRAGLRMLDAQIVTGLAALGLDAAQRPTGWPQPTLRWWRAISRMPHCAVWTPSDWQFALDTAVIAAAFHAGTTGWRPSCDSGRKSWAPRGVTNVSDFSCPTRPARTCEINGARTGLFEGPKPVVVDTR